MKKYLPWLLTAYIAFVFIQSLFFKFTGSEETVIIFSTIGTWMASVGFSEGIATGFALHGGIAVGSVELLASILLFIPKTRLFGALTGFAVINGAIFFHLFTPLGVNRVIDATGNTDGGVLFMMACGVWVCCLALIYLSLNERITRIP
jgi:hypothetical protein